MPDKKIDQTASKEQLPSKILKTEENQPVETEFKKEKKESLSSEKEKTRIETVKPSFGFPQLKNKKKVIPQLRDEVTVKIEKILEEGLSEPYQRLSPIAQQEFKLRGEQTAITIRQLMKRTHVSLKKILRLILEWLRLLPGLNRFFLEQEAKIKAEKIVELKDKL